jgi:hypothetical protein
VGVYWVYLVITCVFLLNKLGYFAAAGVFTLLLATDASYLVCTVVILVSCGPFLGYVLVSLVITAMVLVS